LEGKTLAHPQRKMLLKLEKYLIDLAKEKFPITKAEHTRGMAALGKRKKTSSGKAIIGLRMGAPAASSRKPKGDLAIQKFHAAIKREGWFSRKWMG